jgi:RNA polymerase sigma factor (TIGR02999 family)
MNDRALSTLQHSNAPLDVRQAAEQLLPMFYADVKRLARRERRRVGAGDTLQTTVLINEAYLKLVRSPAFNDRAHFLRASALAMRHVLINYALENLADKRGGGAIVESLSDSHDVGLADDQALIHVHDALSRLALLDERLAQIVECRFFAGYSEEDTALALGISDRTVRRDWIKARAWLRRELSEREIIPADDSDAGIDSSRGGDRKTSE